MSTSPPWRATRSPAGPTCSAWLAATARRRSSPASPRRSNALGLPDERWFRNLTDKAIRRGVFHSVPDLIAAIEAYLQANNDEPKPFVWTATADEILQKVRRGRVALQPIAS